MVDINEIQYNSNRCLEIKISSIEFPEVKRVFDLLVELVTNTEKGTTIESNPIPKKKSKTLEETLGKSNDDPDAELSKAVEVLEDKLFGIPPKKVMERPPVLDDELKEYILQNENMPTRQLSSMIKEVFDKKVSANVISNFRRDSHKNLDNSHIIEFLGENGPCSIARILERFPEIKSNARMSTILNKLKSEGHVVMEYGAWGLSSESEREPENASPEWGG